MSVLYFGLSEDKSIALRIAEIRGAKLSELDLVYFADGETLVRPREDVSGKSIVLIHTLSGNVNTSFFQLIMALDVFKRGNAGNITLVFPYYFYGRQDKQFQISDPIGARLVAQMISGVDKLIVLDLHSPNILNFFGDSVEVSHMGAFDLFLNCIENTSNLVVVSPDAGGVERAKKYSTALKVPLIVAGKKRVNGECKFELSQDNVGGYRCLIVDDILDTGGTICGISEMLKSMGVSEIIIFATHALLSNNALNKLQELHSKGIIDAVWVTNSIPRDLSLFKFIRVIDVSGLLESEV